MATTQLTEVIDSGYRKIGVTKDTIGTGENGTPIKINGWPFTVTCIPVGTGKIQYTTSLPSEIVAGTATWHDWAKGVVAAAASDVPEGPVTGIRGVSASGALVVEVVQ